MAEPKSYPVLERFSVALLLASGLLGGVGGLLAALGDPLERPGLALAHVGLAAGLVAAATSIPIDTLRTLRAETTGGTEYDRLRGQRALRVASALLGFLMIAATLLLLLLGGVRIEIVAADLDLPLVQRGLLVLVSAMALAISVAHLQSLRTPLERDRSALPTTVGILALGVAVLFLGLSLVALAGSGDLLGDRFAVHAGDQAGLLLAGFTLLAFALARTRTLPDIAALLAKEEAYTGRRSDALQRTTLLVPAIMAFALLLVIFLLFLLFGIGVGDLLVSVGKNPLLLGILAFLVLSLIASVVIGLALARSAEKEEPLFKVLLDPKLRAVRVLQAVSGLVGIALLTMAALAFVGVLPRPLWLHLLCLGLMTLLGPYGFYVAREHNRIRRLEERFPDFLRDIASSHKGGLTLHQSVTIAARGDYGPLTPEVRKMADQLSWNVSFHEALERFSERVKTPLVQRAVSLILQADRSGGATTDVLLAAARDAREIKNLENERRLTMSLYTVIVYITFFVFLGVAAVLYARFAPQIVASGQAVEGLSVEEVGGLGGGLDLEQYRLFYFAAAVVQGVGDGILAGLLGSGRANLGLRHAFLMVLITYVTFALLL